MGTRYNMGRDVPTVRILLLQYDMGIIVGGRESGSTDYASYLLLLSIR